MNDRAARPRDRRELPAHIARTHRRTTSARGRRGRGEASVADLVPKVLGAGPLEARLFRLMAAWERELPDRLVRSARPVRLTRDVLVVAATTSAWAQEVTLRSRSILETLARAVPDVRLAGLRARTEHLPERIIAEPPRARRVVPLERLPSDLELELARISDEKLRAAIEQAMRTSLGEPKPARRA